MKYVALLRGINVGGKNKVEMPRLVKLFEQLGHTKVKSYINSGNVIFESTQTDAGKLVKQIEAAINKEFGFSIKVVLRTKQNIDAVIKALPAHWINDTKMKTDVMFLWEEVDSPDVIKSLIIKPDIDEVKYVAGVVLWRVDRDKVTRSGLLRIVGTDLYKKMTIRNCNTVRRLALLMAG